MLVRISFTLAALSLASGCASITRGSTNEVSFTSIPSGANVETSLGQSCQTPCTMIFERRAEFVATFTHEDETRTIDVVSDIAANGVGAVAGNVLFGGVIGAGVDVATGAGLDHFPDPVHADFGKPQSEQIQGIDATKAANAES